MEFQAIECDKNPFIAFLDEQFSLLNFTTVEATPVATIVTVMRLSTILEDIGIGEHVHCWYISEDAFFSMELTQDTNVWIDETVDEVMHDKSVIGDFSVNIKVQFPQLSHEFLIPYRAVICGFEQITVKKGPLDIYLELDSKNHSDEYFK